MRARIVTDDFAGYEVQIWRWWFPFWVQYEVNTFFSIERARAFAKSVLVNRVVEYVKEGE